MDKHLHNVCKEQESKYEIWFKGDEEEVEGYYPDFLIKVHKCQGVRVEFKRWDKFYEGQYVPIFDQDPADNVPEKLRFLADAVERINKESDRKYSHYGVVAGDDTED